MLIKLIKKKEDWRTPAAEATEAPRAEVPEAARDDVRLLGEHGDLSRCGQSWHRVERLAAHPELVRHGPAEEEAGPVRRAVTTPGVTRAALPLLALLFFLSGAAALVYQVLWLRLLALVFGVTVYAASTVLASFMGGLALGSVLGGRLADRLPRPLLGFGLAEVLVGLSALATPALLRGVESAYVSWTGRLPESFAVLTLLRLLASGAVLIVPTTLMGATLPLVLRSSLAETVALGPRVGALYAANAAGAISGCLLAGYVLVGRLGIGASFRLAALVNLLVGVVAAALAWGIPAARAGGRERGSPEGEPEAPPGLRRLVLLVFALSGLVSLALEVMWFRLLLAFLPTTTYAFTTMLATVLGGIAAGSAAVAPTLRRHRDEATRLAWLELGIGLATLTSLQILARTYAAGWRTSGLIQACVVALFPAAFLMGMAFPVGLKLWAVSRAGAAVLGGRVGSFTAVNLAGSILGSLLAGFWLLPALGSRASLVAMASLSLLSGLLLFWAGARQRPRTALGGAGFGLLAFAALAATLPDPFEAALARRYRGERPLWREESVHGTVSVHVREDGTRALYIDGMHQASDVPEIVATHRRIGLLPLVLHPRPRRVLVLGLAGGATAGAASFHPDVTLDVVELSSAVVRAAGFFRHVNHGLLERPNVRLRIDDGRNYLLLTDKRYDVITADLIQPFHAGAGHLYSAEYFRLCRRALAEGGLMMQWIGHPQPAQYKLILRTFLSVFPETTLWAGTLLVGATQPLMLSAARLSAALQEPALRQELARLGVGDLAALLELYTAGPDELRAFAGEGETLTDDHPRVEYFLSLPRGEGPLDLSGLRGDPRRHVTP